MITNAAGAVTSTVAALTVNRLVPALTWATPGAVTYATMLSAAQLNASAGAAGSHAYNPAVGTVLGAGERTLNVTFTPGDSRVHVPANASVSLAVSPAPLSITASNQSREYGRTNPVLTVSYAGLVNGETAAVLTTPAVAATGADANSLPGNFAITVSGASAANYVITHFNGALTVTAEAPVITAPPTNVTVIQGQNASFTVGASGTSPLRYQWLLNATNVLTGATNSSLTLSNAQPASEGG